MLAVALIHYPTVNKEGRVVTTSVTNFDIHDIARASRTYGVDAYFIVTPVEMQRRFSMRIVEFWMEGEGAEYNPTRRDALRDVYVVADLSEAADALGRDFDVHPLWVATSARRYSNSVSCDVLRARLEAGEHACLIFGTGYGLHPQVIEEADLILDPIHGPTEFNHLSVRSAVSIYLDRLRARDR